MNYPLNIIFLGLTHYYLDIGNQPQKIDHKTENCHIRILVMHNKDIYIENHDFY